MPPTSEMPKKVPGGAAAARFLALLLAAAAGFAGLGRGLPSAELLNGVFGGEAGIERAIPDMIAARRAHYERADGVKLAGSLYVGQGLGTPDRGRRTAELMTPREVAGSLRSFLLGSFIGDETWSISIISRMRPAALDLDPGTLMYGGAYLYVLCLMLGAVVLSGALPLSPGISYFFLHPEKTAAVFIVFRTLSALSLVASAALLFGMMKRRFGAAAALAAAVLCAMAPTAVYHAHIAKPHAYAMFWSLLAFYFSARLAEGGRRRDYMLAGAASGLAMGALLPNGLAFSSVFFAAYLREGSLRTAWRDLALALLCMTAAFFLTNPYALFSGLLLSTLTAANSAYSYGTVRLADIPGALGVLFSGAVSWTYAPLLVLGTFAAFRRPSPFTRLLALTAWTFILANVLFLRHPGPFCAAVPLIAALCALALRALLVSGGLPRAAGAAWLALVLAVGGGGALNLLLEFSEKPNLLSAGEWINSSIPPGSSVGFPIGADLRPAVSPYMRFLDYRIYRLNRDVAPEKGDFLPEYAVVSTFSRRYLPEFGEWFLRNYVLEKDFPKRRRALAAAVNDLSALSPQTEVHIYRRR